MEAKPQFHGSDTAAVAAFYHVPVDEIVCFGANVNPLGLSKNLKKDLAAHLDLLSSYPDRNYTTLKKVIADYCQILPCNRRKWFYRADLSPDPDTETTKNAGSWTNLFRVWT